MQFRFCWCEVHRHCQLNCTGLQVLRLALCSSPPSYDTVAKIDKVELPTYQQACRGSSSPAKL